MDEEGDASPLGHRPDFIKDIRRVINESDKFIEGSKPVEPSQGTNVLGNV